MITFLDKLKTEEEKEEVFDKASMATGSSGERTYFIANYTNGNAVQSNEVDLLALEILDSVLLFAEKFILVRKQLEKNKMDREVMAKGRTFCGETEPNNRLNPFLEAFPPYSGIKYYPFLRFQSKTVSSDSLVDIISPNDM